MAVDRYGTNEARPVPTCVNSAQSERTESGQSGVQVPILNVLSAFTMNVNNVEEAIDLGDRF